MKMGKVFPKIGVHSTIIVDVLFLSKNLIAIID